MFSLSFTIADFSASCHDEILIVYVPAKGFIQAEKFTSFCLMQANKENIESVHRIDPESTGEMAERFDELVQLLEHESD